MQKMVEKLSRAPKSYGMIPKKCNIYLESQKQMREKKEQKKVWRDNSQEFSKIDEKHQITVQRTSEIPKCGRNDIGTSQ